MKKLICALFAIIVTTFFAAAMAGTTVTGNIMNASTGGSGDTISLQPQSDPIFKNLPNSITTKQRIVSYSVTPPGKGFSNNRLLYGNSLGGCTFYFSSGVGRPAVSAQSYGGGEVTCEVSGYNLSVRVISQ